MENKRPDAAELGARIKRLQKNLKAAGIEAGLFVQEMDRYYLTSTMQSGYVLVPAEGAALILMRKSYPRALRECPLPLSELESIRKLPDMVRDALGKTPETLGVSFDVLPHGQFLRLKAMFPDSKLMDVSHAMALTRGVKSEWEIGMIRGAARIVGEAVAEVKNILKPGITEIELAARVEYEMRRRGHGGFTPMRGFNQRLHYGHIFAGETAAEPGGYDMPTVGRGLSPAAGQGPSHRAIAAGEPVVVDVVGHFEGYLCDQTRMFSMGPTDPAHINAFDAALKVQKAVAEAAKPGAKASDLFALAEKTAAETGLGANFLGFDHKVTFVGHGIGLEVDEYPFLAKGFDLLLEEGMVFALEPKFTFKDRAAIGVEDTYAVRLTGGERLTVTDQEFFIV